MNYPNEHKEIVDALTKGCFILHANPLYNIIIKKEDDYNSFFEATFGYELHCRRGEGYIYLTTEDTSESDSRNFVLFLALLCRELHTSGKDFKEMIDYKKFEVEETEQLLNKSVKAPIFEYILKSIKGDFKNFLKKWHQRNIIEFTNHNRTQFKFTKAVYLFFEYAVEVSEKQLKKEVQNKV